MNPTAVLNAVPVPGRREGLALVVGLVAVAADVGRLQLGVALDPRLAALSYSVCGGDAGGALGPPIRHGAVHHGAGHPSLALLVAESSGASAANVAPDVNLLHALADGVEFSEGMLGAHGEAFFPPLLG